jgi:hypothetical protein
MRIVILIYLNIDFIIVLQLIKNKIYFQPYVTLLEMRYIKTFFLEEI